MCTKSIRPFEWLFLISAITLVAVVSALWFHEGLTVFFFVCLVVSNPFCTATRRNCHPPGRAKHNCSPSGHSKTHPMTRQIKGGKVGAVVGKFCSSIFALWCPTRWERYTVPHHNQSIQAGGGHKNGPPNPLGRGGRAHRAHCSDMHSRFAIDIRWPGGPGSFVRLFRLAFSPMRSPPGASGVVGKRRTATVHVGLPSSICSGCSGLSTQAFHR